MRENPLAREAHANSANPQHATPTRGGQLPQRGSSSNVIT